MRLSLLDFSRRGVRLIAGPTRRRSWREDADRT